MENYGRIHLPKDDLITSKIWVSHNDTKPNSVSILSKTKDGFSLRHSGKPKHLQLAI